MILTKDNIDQIDLDGLINRKVQFGETDELLLIVPTNRKIRSLYKELISITPGKTTTSIHLETLSTISTKLLQQKRTFNLINDSVSFVLIKQSISEVELRYFSCYKGEIPSGSISRIINVIDEYKKQGITPNILRSEVSSLEGLEKQKGLDIADIYEKYQSHCNELSAKAIGDIYYDLIKLSKDDFSGCFKKCYDKVSYIIIDGFDEFSNLEIEIIELLSCSNGIRVYINFDYYKYNPSIFSHLDKCYDKLVIKGFKSIKDNSYIDLENYRDIIREKLFKRNNIQKEFRYSDQIIKIEAADREKEIESIAKEIKNLIIEKKAEPHQICVSFNLIEKYSPIIRDLFTKYGIPFNLTDRYRLNESTAIIAIINFLEILENDFYYKNIFRALNNGIFELGDIDIIGLMKISKELKIVSGYKNWNNSIKDAIEILKDKENYGNKESDERGINYLEKALQSIKRLWLLLEPFSKKQNYRVFLTNLESLLLTLKINSKLVEDLNERSEIDIKSLSVFLETIYEIFTIFERNNQNEEHSISYYLEKIRSIALSTRYNVHEKSKYGIQITTLNEIRGLKFDYLFICGLCDGDFPTKYNPEIFFSNNFIRGEQNHRNKERYHFYQGLNLWRKKLYLTYPMMDGNKELVESSFIKDFCSIFETTKKTIESFSDAFYSKDEILKLVGKIDNFGSFNELFPVNNIFDWQALRYSLDVAKIRKNKTCSSIYSGCIKEQEFELHNRVLSDEAADELKNLTSQQFSVTQLEKYAACPFQYFLSKVLKVEVIEEPSEEIESIEIGTLLHSILCSFYSELMIRGILLGGCNDKIFKEAEELIFSIAEEILTEKTFKSPLSFYEQERIMGINKNRMNSILFKFLEFERENNSEFIPKFFEVSFGQISDNYKNMGTKFKGIVKIKNLKFAGQIDRLEINEKERVFNVVDYKLSGKKPSLEDLQSGLSLQLPFYMFVASEILKEKYSIEFEPAGIFIYSLKFKAEEFGKIPVCTRKNKVYELIGEEERQQLINFNKGIIENCIEKMNLFIQDIGEGRFNLSTLENRESRICQYCNYQSICRVEEIK